VLFARYRLDEIATHLRRDHLNSRVRSMWRYAEVLPVNSASNVITLGEGFTPILHLKREGEAVGLEHLQMKNDGLIPTGTFKARGMASAISKCKELGVRTVAVATAGNAGAAMSAYGSRASIESHVFMPKSTPTPIRLECEIYGAHVTLVDGSISDAGNELERVREDGWMILSTMREPYRVEGKKTMGFEVAEQLNWALPDVIVYPTGGGTGIVGMWKAFDELEKLGWISGKKPRLVSVQPSGCAPVVRAMEEGKETCEVWEDPHTIAVGLEVPKAYGDYLILQALRSSRGTAISVHDSEILKSMKQLAKREGIWVCPEGAATCACLPQLIENGFIDKQDTVLLYNTGLGILYPELI
jgi:threonine synthase